MIQIEDDELNAARAEAQTVLAEWGFSAAETQVVGAVPGMAGAVLRPVVEVNGRRYLVRWQDHQGRQHRVSGAMAFQFRSGRIAEIDGAF